ncbi:myosin light chain B [Plasmodium sp. gorilla clade G1]|nr:myosin light chain B [Plasmodium sp. gorilla clade G1]
MKVLKTSKNNFVHPNKSNQYQLQRSLFRKNCVSFYEDFDTEAIFLLDKGSRPIYHKLKDKEWGSSNNQKDTEKKKKKEEFEKIDEIISNAEHLNNLRNKLYSFEYQNILEPLGIYISQKEDKEENIKREMGNFYKDEYEILKKKYIHLKENMDTILDVERIKAGLFYTKEDLQKIFEIIRKHQSKINNKNDIIKFQSSMLEKAIEHNKKNKLTIIKDKRKNEKLLEICKSYYEQNEKAQKKLRHLKYSFLEYKIALENIVSCCEKIGGDKIILMDGIKSARAQADMSIANDIKNKIKIEELEMNISYCEQQINYLKDDLDFKMEELRNTTLYTEEVKNEASYFKQELSKNNDLLLEVMEHFHQMINNVDEFIYKNKDKNELVTYMNKKKKKYGDITKKISEKNKELNLKVKNFVPYNFSMGTELKKHEEYLKIQMDEMKKKEEEEKRKRKEEEEEEQKKRKEEEEEEQKKRKEEEEKIEKKKKEEEEEKRKKEEQELLEEKDIKNNETFEEKKIRLVKELMKEVNEETLSLEKCVDIIYKANLPLTQNKLNKLKNMGDIKKDELVTFVKTLMLNEQEAFENMKTFFEIWDIMKTGYMHKNLIISILKQFGDNLTEEESNYIQKELNQMSESNISYVKLLKKWIYGTEE